MKEDEKIDIRALADLARIGITDEELEHLRGEFEDIVGFVKEIRKAGGEPKERSDAHRNVLRDDAHPHESGAHSEDLLKAAPRSEDGYVIVNQVIDKTRKD